MYELLFIIVLDSGAIIKERFTDASYFSFDQCFNYGVEQSKQQKERIKAEYPNFSGFGVDCEKVGDVA